MILHVDCSISRVRKGTWCCSRSLEHARTNKRRWCVGNWPAQVSLMCLVEFVVLGSPLPPSLSHSFAVAQRVLSLRTLCLSLDTRRVRVCMFGYAKCSRASQVECLMALFCLNTDLDTTAERHLRICIHSLAAPTCSLASPPPLPRIRQAALARFTLNYIKELRLRFYASSRCDSAFQRARPVTVRHGPSSRATAFCGIASCESSGSF